MSQIAVWTALVIIGGLFLLVGVQAYALDKNVTSMGNVTNMGNETLGNSTNSTAMGNTTVTSEELEQTGSIATIPTGDGG
jgi:hypothetical protein